jgi:hypothetical protein
MSENRKQKTDVREQRTEIRRQKLGSQEAGRRES